jgi:hypothetical protein
MANPLYDDEPKMRDYKKQKLERWKRKGNKVKKMAAETLSTRQ